MIGSRILQQLSSMQLRGIDLSKSWKLVSNAVPGVCNKCIITTVMRREESTSSSGRDDGSSDNSTSDKNSSPTDNLEKKQKDFRMAGRTTSRSLSVAAKKRAMNSSEEGQLREAAVNVAKMISQDWSRTADTLLDRLNKHKDDPIEEVEPQQPEEEVSQPPLKHDTQESLLETMFVGRAFNKESVQEGRRSQIQRYESKPNEGIRRQGREQQIFSKRQSDSPSGLFSRKRIGIFSEGESLGDQQVSVLGQGLWEEMEREKLKTALGGLPHNAFEEQIEMTQKGMLWTFPINNEEDMHEERKYKFHEHVFLEKHLSQFPKSGPIRKFMELVCVGLSKNPWYTVPEKIEHIQWYADYFREKQGLLEKSIENKDELMRQASVEQ